MTTGIDVLDGTFKAQAERMKRLVDQGRFTPELASVLLSYYAMGRREATGEVCNVNDEAKAFNPDHEVTILHFRISRPARLIFDS